MDKLSRVVFNRFTALVLGLALLGFSIMIWTSDSGPIENVYCEGDLMRPGDSCIHTDYDDPDNNRTNSLEEERAEQERANETNDTVLGLLCPALSVLALGGSVLFMIRRRRRSRVAAVPAGPV